MNSLKFNRVYFCLVRSANRRMVEGSLLATVEAGELKYSSVQRFYTPPRIPGLASHKNR